MLRKFPNIHKRYRAECHYPLHGPTSHCEPFQDSTAVKSIKILNINPRSRANKIKKQQLTFIQNYNLCTKFWSPQHRKASLGERLFQ